MTYQTFLKLGRVSNLPTVWTNAIAGAVLAGLPSFGTIVIVAVALTLFYVGGMWLNDAFDAEIDAREKANRPIPMGEVAVGTVFAGGFAMLGLGIVLAFAMGVAAGLAGLCLAALVVLYDWLHKRTVLSPVIMGGTRFFCYVLAALAVGAVTGWVILGALGLLAYTAGLTYAAKQEAYDRLDRAWPLAVLALPVIYALTQTSADIVALLIWAGLLAVVLLALRLLFRRAKGDVPKAVVTMIAGMSLYDATLIAGAGYTALALLAVAGFALTLYLQRVVSGT
ncbi:UbiA family prenyltransferase [Marimonas arenosa]|uniref:UbiA family prenyltransferase n=1 Tax=Marimonas arenosa TaxID=1795305 RepID=A0AAE3WFS0_9RHOB|nr:UbiA family prenyltransferase [Marimonas arenosa]MDQ2090838.1 UbiA family prenyltransferase [Marimonas arenosa]